MHRLNIPFVNFLLVALIYGVYLILLLSKFQYNPNALISLGEKFVDFEKFSNRIIVYKDYGYDGQFYYRLALNPFTSKQKEFGISLDTSSYRQQRILYPLLTWLVSFGNKELVPFVLLGINLIALSLIGLFGGYFAKSLNVHPFWGLIFAIYPGFLFTLSRNLTEILQTLFLLVTLIMIKKHRFLTAALMLTLAVLTRETVLVVAISLVLTLKNRYFLIPILVYLVWQLILYLNWAVAPIFLANTSLGYPFAGIVPYFQQALDLVMKGSKLRLIQLCFFLIFTLSVFYVFRTSKSELFMKISFCVYLLMAISYTSFIWVMDIAYFRALTEFYIIGSAILMSANSRMKSLIFYLTIIIWLLSAKLFAYF